MNKWWSFRPGPLVWIRKSGLQSEEGPRPSRFPVSSLQRGIAGTFQFSNTDRTPEAERQVLNPFIFILGLNSLDWTTSGGNEASPIYSTDIYGVSNMNYILGLNSKLKRYYSSPRKTYILVEKTSHKVNKQVDKSNYTLQNLMWRKRCAGGWLGWGRELLCTRWS